MVAEGQLDHRRGWVGFDIHYGVFCLMKVLASIYALCITQNGGSHAGYRLCRIFSPRQGRLRGYSYRFPQIQLTCLLPMKASSKEDAEFVDYGELDIHIFEDGQQRNIYHDFNRI
jgi:hypothetical protein